jgi:hypothetical protein
MKRGISAAAVFLLLVCILSGCSAQPTAKLPTPEKKEDEAPEITGLEPDPVDSEFWDSANLQLRIRREGRSLVASGRYTETTHVTILLDEEGSWEFTGVGFGSVDWTEEAPGVSLRITHDTECTVMGKVLPDQCALEFLLISDVWLDGQVCGYSDVLGALPCDVAEGDVYCWGDQDYFATSPEALANCELGHWVVPLYEKKTYEAAGLLDTHVVSTFEIVGVDLNDLPEACSEKILSTEE